LLARISAAINATSDQARVFAALSLAIGCHRMQTGPDVAGNYNAGFMSTVTFEDNPTIDFLHALFDSTSQIGTCYYDCHSACDYAGEIISQELMAGLQLSSVDTQVQSETAKPSPFGMSNVVLRSLMDGSIIPTVSRFFCQSPTRQEIDCLAVAQTGQNKTVRVNGKLTISGWLAALRCVSGLLSYYPSSVILIGGRKVKLSVEAASFGVDMPGRKFAIFVGSSYDEYLITAGFISLVVKSKGKRGVYRVSEKGAVHPHEMLLVRYGAKQDNKRAQQAAVAKGD